MRSFSMPILYIIDIKSFIVLQKCQFYIGSTVTGIKSLIILTIFPPHHLLCRMDYN